MKKGTHNRILGGEKVDTVSIIMTSTVVIIRKDFTHVHILKCLGQISLNSGIITGLLSYNSTFPQIIMSIV